MTVEAGPAEPGKMLATTQNARIMQSTQKLAGVTNGLDWISGNSTGVQSALRCFEAQIDTWSEVGIKSQCAELLANQLSLFVKQSHRSSCGNIGNRRHRRDHITKPIDSAAFHVHAAKHRGRDGLLRCTQQRECLRCIRNIAFEEYDAARMKRTQHRPQMRRDTSPVEAHDEQLAHLLAKIEAGFRRHRDTGSVSRNPDAIQYAGRYGSVDLSLEFMQQIERIKRADGIQVRLFNAVNNL